MSGDTTLVKYWPDLSGPDLSPVDVETAADNSVDSHAGASHEALRRSVEAGQSWQLGSYEMPDERQERPALYTFFDLTTDNEAAVARKELDLTEQMRARREAIAPIVNAIENQVQTFLSEDLPKSLTEDITEKRKELNNRQRVRESLSFPDEWKGSEPELLDSQFIGSAPVAEARLEPVSEPPTAVAPSTVPLPEPVEGVSAPRNVGR